MKTIKLTDDWDLFIDESGKVQYIDGAKMDNQDIATILKTNKGEDYFHQSLGVDWFMIINYPTRSNIIDGINDAISQFRKPVAIRDLSIEEDEENRKYNIKLDLKVGNEFINMNFNVGG